MADLSIARYLLPRLIAFTTNTDSEDPERARALISQTLSSYVATVSKDHTPIAMALVVPTLLSRAASSVSSDGEDDNVAADAVYRETSARLLELASVDAQAFRAVVAGMSDSQKAFMEEVIRSGRRIAAGHTESDVASDAAPSIALKMDFGG